MQDLKLPTGSTAIIIVAHPDDETIWFGGTILKNPQVNWTILCLSRVSDADRQPKFKKICDYYHAASIMEDWDDEGKLTAAASLRAAKKIITAQLAGKHFDFLFTHGANGEYGHTMHRAVHEAVVDLLKRRIFSVGAPLAFNYKKISKYKLSVKQDCDVLIKLDKKIFAEKQSLVSSLYGFAPDGIDVGYCTNPEGLKFIKI